MKITELKGQILKTYSSVLFVGKMKLLDVLCDIIFFKVILLALSEKASRIEFLVFIKKRFHFTVTGNVMSTRQMQLD